MEMNLDVRYRVILTPEEFRLVSKALRGGIKDEDRADALALQTRMQQMRASNAENMLGQFDKEAEAAEGGQR